ncbi:orotidine-5'-phosphate decarboxylase [Lutispora sp.]|uniref:orotidine-5'-phosphate decarboxylase n=1 Tax=Lutispora sp. TaxID=2828727 RepID=UPI003567BA57
MKRKVDLMFTDRLIERIISMKNHSIVGIDPSYSIIPQFLKDKYIGDNGGSIESISEMLYVFSIEIIDHIYDIVPAVKPQIAFFERYGSAGLKIFEKVCSYAKEKGLLVIADIKRGDIGSTCEAYAEYYLSNATGSLDCDAITINPYLGRDSINPFVEKCIDNDKGLFILVKTSNKSSIDIQDLISEQKRIYEHVAGIVSSLGEDFKGEKGYSPIGAVVGGTFKEEGEKLRQLMKNCYCLVPGFGAQGGVASDLPGYFNEDGLGAVINSSRGIIGAYLQDKYRHDYDEKSYGTAARMAAISMRDEINKCLREEGKMAW